MPDLEPISVRQPRLSFPHVDDFLTSIMKHFEYLSLQSSLTTNTFISWAKMFYLHSLTTFNKCSLLNLQNYLLPRIKQQVNLGQKRGWTQQENDQSEMREKNSIIILKKPTHALPSS